MCGIAGILTRSLEDRELLAAVGRMTAAIQHRGPDAGGAEVIALPGDSKLALGHRRLAILDLSDRGRQPMGHPESGSWVSFNGEIYNHQSLRGRLPDEPFQSSTDTETLLRGWVRHGSDWLDQQRGIFAFGLYDGRRRELWLVRDRLGVKPLYVCRPTPEMWLFASEVRALLASGLVERRVSQAGLASYLRFGAVQSPLTLVEGVHSLLPAECWRFDLSLGNAWLEPQRRRYWTPSFEPRVGQPGPADFERLSATWQESAEIELLSDVPVGVFLSGGIDSSAVVATLARAGHVPQTFSVAFPNTDLDESEHARAVAQACGAEHHELRLAGRDVLEGWDAMLEAYDQPSVDGINTYLISRAVRAAGIKVALSGLGGDEAFAGYGLHRQFAWFDRLRRWQPRWAGALAAAGMRQFAGAAGRHGKLTQLAAGRLARWQIYAVLREQLPPKWRQALLPHATAAEQAGICPVLAGDLSRQVESLDPVNAALWLDASLYMQNTLLRDADQMSMAHALEVRVPLLDHVLWEELIRWPGQVKLAQRGTAQQVAAGELGGRTVAAAGGATGQDGVRVSLGALAPRRTARIGRVDAGRGRGRGRMRAGAGAHRGDLAPIPGRSRRLPLLRRAGPGALGALDPRIA